MPELRPFDGLGTGPAGPPGERLTPAQAAARYPFLNPNGFIAAAAAAGAALSCQRIAAGLLDRLAARGAAIRVGARIADLDPERAVAILANGKRMQADRLVVAGGGWTTRLLPRLSAELTTWRTHVAYVDPPAEPRAAWVERR